MTMVRTCVLLTSFTSVEFSVRSSRLVGDPGLEANGLSNKEFLFSGQWWS